MEISKIYLANKLTFSNHPVQIQTGWEIFGDYKSFLFLCKKVI